MYSQPKELFEIRIRKAKVKKMDKEAWDIKDKNKNLFQINTYEHVTCEITNHEVVY